MIDISLTLEQPQGTDAAQIQEQLTVTEVSQKLEQLTVTEVSWTQELLTVTNVPQTLEQLQATVPLAVTPGNQTAGRIGLGHIRGSNTARGATTGTTTETTKHRTPFKLLNTSSSDE